MVGRSLENRCTEKRKGRCTSSSFEPPKLFWGSLTSGRKTRLHGHNADTAD